MVSAPHPIHPESETPAHAVDERSHYSISQAAALLGVSRMTVWRWIRAGRLPVARLGHRTTRIRCEDLDRLLALGGPIKSLPRIVTDRPIGLAAETGEDGAHAHCNASQAPGSSEHVVHFYESDAFILDAVGDFIGTGLQAGESAVVLATQTHREELESRLQAAGLDLPGARASDRYIALDAAETLARFMVDGEPAPTRFAEILGSIVARAAAGGRRVRAFGEMVALLAAEENHAAAVRVEALWNGLRQAHTFSLFCAYPMAVLGGSAFTALLGDVCAEHSRVIPAESYAALTNTDERLRAIAVLQQQAASLEAEIVERRRAEEQLRVALASERGARKAAEAALRLRDEFLSIASHELRTPLTTLRTHAQLALRRLQRAGQLEPERVAQALQAISGQSERLSRLLNQLLDISRLEAGKLGLELQPTDLAALVVQVVSDARVLSERHTLALTAPASLQAAVDPLRLEQVLTNLLENAVKYSPHGGSIEVSLSQPQPAVAEFSVRDHGLGIPPERRTWIFERFYQAHAGGYRSGMGLGLYISRQIVELHGGEIWAEFPFDGGTCFMVRLPLTR